MATVGEAGMDNATWLKLMGVSPPADFANFSEKELTRQEIAGLVPGD
jgi:hypothetical protein